ncbi:MAG: orotidine-5'-phosphate decarboxylase [DPANN group archaeon]|nr:orotidine-5'-phosphate decarboxylase [DPANN group archaeon]
MNYLDKLRESAKTNNSIVCMGLDPVVEAMPEQFKGIREFNLYLGQLFHEMKEQGVLPGAFKPNQGFYLKHDRPRRTRDFSGSVGLSLVMNMIEEIFPGTPIILDYKRGDIAKSSANYGIEGFDVWEADAVTVSPYMGTDSVMPFGEYCNEEQGKGVYVLDRTSNKGARDFQNLMSQDLPLYKHVASKIVEWAADHPGIGAVVGATSPEELSDLAEFFTGKDIPLLIPGVGSQGGSAEEVSSRLRDVGYGLSIIRINSSSGLTHPWKKPPAPEDFAKVCVAELHKLNEQIGYTP